MKFNKTQVLILAGGRGTRINEITRYLPKPLIKFNNKDLLGLIIRNFTKYDFNEIIILAGYKGYKIKKKYHKKKINLVNIKCVIEKKRMGTLGAIILNKKLIKNNFILANGDTFFDYDFSKLQKINFKKKVNLIISNNHNYTENTKLNKLSLTKKNIIIKKSSSKYINAGTYFIKKSILNSYKTKNLSIENDLIDININKKKIGGIKSNDQLIDIGTKKNLKNAKSKLLKLLKRPAVFLDRDGVINSDYGYVHKLKDFRLKKGVLKGLKYLSNKRIYIFIVTNQAGIAKNKFSEKQFIEFQKKIKSQFLKNNIKIHEVVYCPFHKNAKVKKFKKNSKFRKPGNLMIEYLFKNWEIDKKKSFMIGDKKTDKIAAFKSGLNFSYPENDFYKLIKKLFYSYKI